MHEPPPAVPSEATAASPARPRPRRRRRILRRFFFFVWLPLVVGSAVYLWVSYRAAGFDASVLTSDSAVTVRDEGDTMTFSPARGEPPASLLFIPGALVDPTAYAPLARSVAAEGYEGVILKLPSRLAHSESQRESVVRRVLDIRAAAPSRRWVIAGHSLGGVLACRVARDHADRVDGLVLIGTSHPRDFGLSHLTLDVTKVFGTNDGLASPPEVKANAGKLPASTHWIEIPGGNHSQFGYYGFQLGDHRATLPRADQQAITAQALLDALSRVSSK
jgi:pimeloyl-ACP methyl ester carboxylesterase